MDKDVFVIRHRVPIIVACLLLAGIMGFQLRKLEINADFLFMFSPHMQSRMNTEKIEKIFGSNDMLFVLFEAQDVLDKATLVRVKNISQELKKVQGITDVVSLFDTKDIRGENGSMIVESAVKAIPTTNAEQQALRQAVLGNELARDIVVSKDFTVTAILLTLDLKASKKDIYLAVKNTVQGFPGKEKTLIGGIPAFQTVIIDNITHDLLILIPGALLVILLILYAFFRQVRGIMLPLCVVLLSTIFGMGILPLMGWKMTLLSAILPIMVVAFSNNYGIYLIARYQDLCASEGNLTKKQIAADVFRVLYKPILFSGITTMVGLLGMLFHSIIPAKQIGIAASIAIGFSLVVSLGGIPAILSMLKLPKEKTKKTGLGSVPLLDPGLRKTANVVVRRPGMVLLAAGIMAAVGIGSATRIVVDANQENLFGKNHPISICTRLINLHFGGSQNVSLLFQGDIKEPRLLRTMENYKDTLQQLPGVGQVTSIADIIRIMSKALNDTGTPGYNRVPETRDAVAQYLELYSMSGSPEDFERLVDFNYEKAQFIVRITDGATPVINAIVRKIGALHEKDASIALVGGWAAMFSELAAVILRGQIISIVSALCAIVILVMFMFRSVTAGLLSAVPLVFAIVIGFGTMGAFGIYLDVATALITSIIIGTGVDFTLQFLWRYRSIRQSGVPYAEAIRETYATIGRAIVFNAFCVASGLGVMVLSSIPPLRYFAILFGVLTLACMCGALIVIPALCMVCKPKFLEPGKTDNT